jgi:hypothetical protein
VRSVASSVRDVQTVSPPGMRVVATTSAMSVSPDCDQVSDTAQASGTPSGRVRA